MFINDPQALNIKKEGCASSTEEIKVPYYGHITGNDGRTANVKPYEGQTSGSSWNNKTQPKDYRKTHPTTRLTLPPMPSMEATTDIPQLLFNNYTKHFATLNLNDFELVFAKLKELVNNKSYTLVRLLLNFYTSVNKENKSISNIPEISTILKYLLNEAVKNDDPILSNLFVETINPYLPDALSIGNSNFPSDILSNEIINDIVEQGAYRVLSQLVSLKTHFISP